jgi:uncharacterized protein
MNANNCVRSSPVAPAGELGRRATYVRMLLKQTIHASKPDPHPDGDRWHTIGLVAPVLLLVIHTWPEVEFHGDEPVGRIISARKATAHERRAYEEGSV